MEDPKYESQLKYLIKKGITPKQDELADISRFYNVVLRNLFRKKFHNNDTILTSLLILKMIEVTDEPQEVRKRAKDVHEFKMKVRIEDYK